MQNQLQKLYGNIDIYLFDQLLKGTYNNCSTILDAGCGSGRNLVYFLNNGYQVYGIDQNAEAVQMVKALSQQLSPTNNPNNFIIAKVEEMPFAFGYFDLVISNAVLHFAENEGHFNEMLVCMWRVLKPGGYFFARLASNIGIEARVQHLGEGRYLLPDGSERFLVDEQTLLTYTENLGDAYLYEPIKTTNVHNLRCMTTWCLQKLHA